MTRALAALALLVAAPLAAQPPTPPAFPSAPSAAPPLTAAQAESQGVAQSGEKLTVNYAVPEMPATTVLGLTPAKIARPITSKDFASSLIDGIDEDGHVRQGIAVEASLGMFRVPNVSLQQYQASRWARVLSNLMVSFATARVASDTQSTDLAWGVRAPLYDAGDPLARPEYTKRLGQLMLTCAPSGPAAAFRGKLASETLAEYRAKFDSAVKALQNDSTLQAQLAARRADQLACLERAATQVGKAAADSLWNAARLVVAYAGSSRLPQSVFKNRRRLEDRVWAVGAYPLWQGKGPLALARSAQLVGYADYVRTHAADSVPASGGASYGVRLNLGSATLNAFGEALGEWRDEPRAGSKRTTSAFSGGVEFLAAPGMWISTGVGSRYSDTVRADKTVLFANLRWGIASKPFLKPGPDAP